MRRIKQLSVEAVARFWTRVYKAPDGCWYWQAARDPNGYGRLCVEGNKTVLAHRVAWAIVHGDPTTSHVLHRCDNPPCVNPDHLFLGTNLDNIRDCHAKGRVPRGECRGNSKLTSDKVTQIRALRLSGLSYQDIGNNFRIAHTTARRICLGITWKHIKAA